MWLLAAGTPPGLGLGQPWDTLFQSAGAALVIILAALWLNKLYLPGVVQDRDKRIEELNAEIASMKKECDTRVQQVEQRSEQWRTENREMTKWLQDQAIPLVARSTDLMKTMSEIVTINEHHRRSVN